MNSISNSLFDPFQNTFQTFFMIKLLKFVGTKFETVNGNHLNVAGT